MERIDFKVRTNIKFLVKIGWKVTEIIQALHTVYKNDATKKICVYKWIEKFRDGSEAAEDDEGRGRPKTTKNNENIDFVRNLVKDGQLTVYQIAETVGISVGAAHSIMHNDLSLSKLSARWVPKALHPNELNLRCELSTAILLKIKADENHFFWSNYHRRWDMGLPVWSWNKTAAQTVAPTWIIWPNQIQVWEVCQEGNGNCFLGLRRSCTSRFFRR